MKARVGNTVFEDDSWNGLVAKIVARFKIPTSPGQRVEAASTMDRTGMPVMLGHITIEPVES